MNIILQNIKNDKTNICQCQWCKDCPLSMAGYPNRKNIFTDIANELKIDKETRYKSLPVSICAREIIMHNFSDWATELRKLIDEVQDMSFDETYDFILNKYPTEIAELKQLMENRVNTYEWHRNNKVVKTGCNCGCK